MPGKRKRQAEASNGNRSSSSYGHSLSRSHSNHHHNHGVEGEGLTNQSLPVGTLPADFNGVPVDGDTYLAMVRREAAGHPDVYLAASNPYHVAWTQAPADPAGLNGHSSRAQQLGIPDEEWRKTFTSRFAGMREAFAITSPDGMARSYAGRLPKARFSDAANRAWFRYIFRKERPTDENGELITDGQAGNDDENDSEAEQEGEEVEEHDAAASAPTTSSSGPRTEPVQPTPSIISRMTVAQCLSLLTAIPYWIAIPPSAFPATDHSRQQEKPQGDSNPTALHPLLSQWCFSVLTKLDGRLTSDEISTLRTLARACIAGIAHRRLLLASTSTSTAVAPSEIAVTPSDGKGNALETKTAIDEGETSAWVVVAIVAGTWGQADLWMDAEDDLARVAAQTASLAQL